MLGRLGRFSIILLLSLVWGAGVPQARANGEREFLLSCTYGLLAGVLVGGASLALEKRPSENLNRVARGASLGLYVGILLGAYVVYVVPGQIEADEQRQLDKEYQKGIDTDDYGYKTIIKSESLVAFTPPSFTIYPVIEKQQMTGAGFQYQLYRF